MTFGQGHPTFLYQPANFYIDDTKYSPDFYDPLHNEFFEVIGSRQRFEQLKDKLRRFKELFPKIKLNVCSPNGTPYHSYKNQDLVSVLAEA
jgi:hypothetical protein